MTCFYKKLNIGDFPAFVVTKIQFDVISIQNKVKVFYENSQFQFIKYQDSSITDCMRKYFIPNSSKKDSPFQLELKSALKNESIDNYYKEIYIKEKIISADDNKMLSITDNLFTKNSETDLFYFIEFTKSMNGKYVWIHQTC